MKLMNSLPHRPPPPVGDSKLEARLNTKDLEALQDAFMVLKSLP